MFSVPRFIQPVQKEQKFPVGFEQTIQAGHLFCLLTAVRPELFQNIPADCVSCSVIPRARCQRNIDRNRHMLIIIFRIPFPYTQKHAGFSCAAFSQKEHVSFPCLFLKCFFIDLFHLFCTQIHGTFIVRRAHLLLAGQTLPSARFPQRSSGNSASFDSGQPLPEIVFQLFTFLISHRRRLGQTSSKYLPQFHESRNRNILQTGTVVKRPVQLLSVRLFRPGQFSPRQQIKQNRAYRIQI